VLHYDSLVCRTEWLTSSRFYYADERKEDGSPKYRVDGDAHADLYWSLAQGETQGPWLQTFVKGMGYKAFDNIYTSLK
jgi:hypothetical protein